MFGPQPNLKDALGHYHEIQKANKIKNTMMLTDTFKNGKRITETTKGVNMKPVDKNNADKKNNMSLRDRKSVV